MDAAISSRTLSKSDYNLARTCDAKLHFRENGYLDDRGYDPYLQLLADGGYMVEALACAQYPEGIQLGDGASVDEEAARTLAYLQRENVTLFQATLRVGRRMARIDIVDKRGDVVRLLEVKAKSFDGHEHADSIANGGAGVFRAKKAPHKVLSEWVAKFEEVTFQTLLLEQTLPNVTVRPHLVLVDKSKRSSIDDLPSLFELLRHAHDEGRRFTHAARFVGSREQLMSLDLLTEIDVSREVDELRGFVDAESRRLEGMLDLPFDVAWARPGAACKECEFNIDSRRGASGFAHCWGDLADVTPHALELFAIGKVKDADGTPTIETLARARTVSLFDIPTERLVRRDGSIGADAARQRRQIEQTRLGAPWIAESLGPSLGALRYPLHFIDFEASRLALPYHAKMRPYGQVAFQWSCHTVDAPGATPRHAEWLNAVAEWPNLKFVRSLRDVIGDDDTVVTWSKFERSQLNEIAGEHHVFAERDADLVAWVDRLARTRLVDLHDCARTEYYHPAMRGSTSIKVVLDALWTSDPAMRAQYETWTGVAARADEDPYHALPALEIAGVRQDVREGTGAIRAYEAMMYGVERRDVDAKAKWRSLLLQYCELDTLSMVLVFEHWRRATARLTA